MTVETTGRAPAMSAPVFCGGTGRSGTTIGAHLIGASARYAEIPVEVRFHCDPGGLADLVDGEVTAEEFVANFSRRWYHRAPVGPRARGTHVITPWHETKPLLSRLVGDVGSLGAARAAARFVRGLFQRYVTQQGAASFVEMTPPVVQAAPQLLEVFPDARFVHMSRDGRDVASSVAARGWGPDTIEECLVWWADRLIDIDDSLGRVPEEAVLHMRLESLVGDAREAAFARLARFVGCEDDGSMRSYFERTVSAARAQPGRWTRDLDDDDRRRIEQLHDQQLARLDAAGVRLEPVMTA